MIGLRGFAIATVVVVAASTATAETWRAEVDGSKFRISTKRDGSIEVANKAVITGRAFGMRDKMRLAVRQATGCSLVDEMEFGTKLRGRLKCPEGHVPRPPVAPAN